MGEQIDVVEAARPVGPDHRDAVADLQIGHLPGRAVFRRYRRIGREAGLAVGLAVAVLVAGLGADIECAGAANLAGHGSLADLARRRAIEAAAEADADAGHGGERGLGVIGVDAGLELAHRKPEISTGRLLKGGQTCLRRERRITDIAAQPAQLSHHGRVRTDAPQGREAFAEARIEGGKACQASGAGCRADSAVTQLRTELQVLLAETDGLADDALELADGPGRGEEGAAWLGLDPLQGTGHRRPPAEALLEGITFLNGHPDLAQRLNDLRTHPLGGCGRCLQPAQEPSHGIHPVVGGGRTHGRRRSHQQGEP